MHAFGKDRRMVEIASLRALHARARYNAAFSRFAKNACQIHSFKHD
jgi:hypothetical protein